MSTVQEQLNHAKTQINQIFDELGNTISQEMASATSGAAAPAGGSDVDLGELRDFCYEMSDAQTQGQIAEIILKAATSTFDRAVLFIIKGGNIQGWQGFGLKGFGSPKDRVQVVVPMSGDSLLKKVASEKVGYMGDMSNSPADQQMIKSLGGPAPQMVAVAPMIMGGRVALMLYGDNVHSGKPIPDISHIEILMNMAEGAMEVVSLRKKANIPPESNKPPRKTRPVAKSQQQPSSPPPQTQPTSPPPAQTQPTSPPPAQTQPSSPPPAQTQPTSSGAGGEQPISAPDQGLPPDMDENLRKQHNEAKSFASVIVSDIALYNQQKIEQGLRDNKLEELLGGEFERGKRLYLQRVSPAIAKTTDYYGDAIKEMIDRKKKSMGLA